MRKDSRSKTEGRSYLRLVGGIIAAVLVLGGPIYWFTRPSPEAILNAASLTPKQIRYVATELLVHEDMKIRARASEKLAAIGQPAVPVLREVSLGYSDKSVREVVLGILLIIDPKGSADVVTRLAGDKDAEIRRIAVSAAVRLPEDQRTPILGKAVADADTGVRLAAMNSLAQARSADNIPLLNRAMKDPNITVRRHAAHTLTVMTGKDYTSQVQSP